LLIKKYSDMKKLLIVHRDLRGGGVERVISLLSWYAPKGYEISLALWNKKINYKLRRGVKVYFIHPYEKPHDFLRSLLDLYTVILKERPDAVMGMKGKSWNLVLFLIGVKRIIRTPSYPIYNHTTIMSKMLYWLKRRLLYPRVNKIIAISREIKRSVIREWQVNPEKIVVIHNPVDMQLVQRLAYEPLKSEEEKIFKGKVILNVGRLEKQKGQWYLIRIFKRVLEEVPEARLVILGEGKLRNYLEEMISELGLAGKVFLLGWKKNPFKYMARSFLFCFPSFVWEGFSNVIIEALACGLPVMSADCLSGPREILAPGTRYRVNELREPEYAEYGILMPVMDGKFYKASDPLTWQEEVWAEEIIKCLKKPERIAHYKKKGPRRAQDFAAEKVVKRYFQTIFGEAYID